MFAPESDPAMMLPTVIIIIAIVTNGLLAGVFFAFVVAIVPGLRRVDDGAYVRAFRAINRAILNGWFISVFMVAPVAAVAGVVAGFIAPGGTSSALLIIGAVLSILSAVITAAANIPLNRGLDEAPIDSAELCRTARLRFETPWNRWHLARTLMSIGAFACLVVAAFT